MIMSYAQILYQLPATIRMQVENIYCPLTRLDSLPNTIVKTLNIELKYLLNWIANNFTLVNVYQFLPFSLLYWKLKSFSAIIQNAHYLKTTDMDYNFQKSSIINNAVLLLPVVMILRYNLDLEDWGNTHAINVFIEQLSAKFF